ncbi:MAG TPA: bifunctional phosphoribosylaminoimidazolecarboxamide formyltransferase/IMP cyclohydrolase PurH, partial [Phnomibacter sp.]|nr:bifunctional phosphoribosylaminoimidazolecarboxamide formyltransferase/IMP cyclohydrolase PurH [Phnomibacter sp.]
MDKKIQSALISVFYKDGLETLAPALHKLGITIYSTGGTQTFIEKLGIPVIPVETLTTYPSILGGRVKTLHPAVFGGILGKRSSAEHLAEMEEYQIPPIDLVIVDLYPFEETVAQYADPYQQEAEAAIIEKVDIGGPSMIRAAAKNHESVVVIAEKSSYQPLESLLTAQDGYTTLQQRRQFAARAFEVVAHYDVAIAKYFNPGQADQFLASVGHPAPLRYGENPHQTAAFYGKLDGLFTKLNGKELSYNNLVDVEAAIQLISEFYQLPNEDNTAEGPVFAIIKHTNVCGISSRNTVLQAWTDALAGDPESAFGGVLVTNGTVDEATAQAINEIFF